jgi:hypothetical protein
MNGLVFRVSCLVSDQHFTECHLHIPGTYIPVLYVGENISSHRFRDYVKYKEKFEVWGIAFIISLYNKRTPKAGLIS